MPPTRWPGSEVGHRRLYDPHFWPLWVTALAVIALFVVASIVAPVTPQP